MFLNLSFLCPLARVAIHFITSYRKGTLSHTFFYHLWFLIIYFCSIPVSFNTFSTDLNHEFLVWYKIFSGVNVAFIANK